MDSIAGVVTMHTSDLSDEPLKNEHLCQEFCRSVRRLSGSKDARVLMLIVDKQSESTVYPSRNPEYFTWRYQCADALRQVCLPVIAVFEEYPSFGDFIVALGADFRFSDERSAAAVHQTIAAGNIDRQLLRYIGELSGKTSSAFRPAEAYEDSSSIFDYRLVTGVGSNPRNMAEKLAKDLINRSPDAISAVKRLYNDSWARREVYETLNQEARLGRKVMFRWNQMAAISRNFTKRPLKFRKAFIQVVNSEKRLP